MKLNELIKGLKVLKCFGDTSIDVDNVAIDSNKVTAKSLFICICGKDYDGHSFVKQVEMYGAVAVITEKKLDTALTQIVVEDSRQAMSVIASNFYNRVDKKLKLIAVVGTNGKTTTAHLIKNVLESSGVKCGVIGTLGSFYCDKYLEPVLTTPDPLELHQIFFDMYNSGIRCVVMEVSAHAIYLNKLKGLRFFAAVFTNFSQDHLDFFESMEKYKQAKLKFFNENLCKYVVSNSDDEVGREIMKLKDGAISYGIENPADVFAVNIKISDKKTEFFINLFDYVDKVSLNLIGKFNVYNAMACSVVCSLLGVKQQEVIRGLNQVVKIDGRLEKVYDGEYKIIIDYAHTPDGLKKVLFALKPITENRLICLFGCGGNRDSSKREIMGEICSSLADFSIITSDNPRYEEPMEIITQIEKGVRKNSKKYIIIEDREDAIKYGIDILKNGDTLLIAGKGSEKYQEILGIKVMFNDKDIVQEYLRRKDGEK